MGKEEESCSGQTQMNSVDMFATHHTHTHPARTLRTAYFLFTTPAHARFAHTRACGELSRSDGHVLPTTLLLFPYALTPTSGALLTLCACMLYAHTADVRTVPVSLHHHTTPRPTTHTPPHEPGLFVTACRSGFLDGYCGPDVSRH